MDKVSFQTAQAIAEELRAQYNDFDPEEEEQMLEALETRLRNVGWDIAEFQELENDLLLQEIKRRFQTVRANPAFLETIRQRKAKH